MFFYDVGERKPLVDSFTTQTVMKSKILFRDFFSSPPSTKNQAKQFIFNRSIGIRCKEKPKFHFDRREILQSGPEYYTFYTLENLIGTVHKCKNNVRLLTILSLSVESMNNDFLSLCSKHSHLRQFICHYRGVISILLILFVNSSLSTTILYFIIDFLGHLKLEK